MDVGDGSKIHPGLIANMDEKGVNVADVGAHKVIVDRDQKTAFTTLNASREWITIVETVFADGSSMHPTVIFKGARTNMEWSQDNPGGAR